MIMVICADADASQVSSYNLLIKQIRVYCLSTIKTLLEKKVDLFVLNVRFPSACHR